MLDAARAAGVTVFQPWRAVGIVRDVENSAVEIETAGAKQHLYAGVVIAAHGSKEMGKLSSNLTKINQPHDFLGFKARFRDGNLPTDLMPLIAFPGGYGGMVWADHDRLSLSFCIRRDALTAARLTHQGSSAAEAAFTHILKFCPGVAGALRNSKLAGGWLAAGPIRPSIRPAYAEDIFRVGNVAGESHPIIAEGIAMARQSGWILAAQLGRFDRWDSIERAAAGRAYSIAWRHQFATRIWLATALSILAAPSPGAAIMQWVVSRFPASLSLGASLSGKIKATPITLDERSKLAKRI